MDCAVTACVLMAHYVVMTYIVMACVRMAYIVMAYIAMAYSYGLGCVRMPLSDASFSSNHNCTGHKYTGHNYVKAITIQAELRFDEKLASLSGIRTQPYTGECGGCHRVLPLAQLNAPLTA